VKALPDADGVLVATARSLGPERVELTLHRCATLDCARPAELVTRTVAAIPAGRRDPLIVRTADGVPDVAYQDVAVAGADVLALTTDGRYALRAQAAPLTAGSAEVFGPLGTAASAVPTERQLVVVERDGARQWRLNVTEHPEPAALLVVRRDRRVLVVEATNRLLIATAHLPG
jgi:hypothetical protein